MCMSTHFRYIERTWVIATKRKPRGLYRLPLHGGFQQAETTAQYEPRSIQTDRPTCTLSRNSQPRLTLFVTTAISKVEGGVGLMNWPKGCARYVGQCTLRRHEYPGFSMQFREWITDLIMCLHLSFWRPKNFVSPQKRAPVYNGIHLPYPLLATREDAAKYGVFGDVTLYKLNPLTPNDPYRDRTSPLTSKSCILHIYLTNIGTECFKHGIYSPLFYLQNAVSFIILTYLDPVLLTFYIQDVPKFKKIPAPKG